MDLSKRIEKTLHGLGYELVGIENATYGLLRVFIDYPSNKQTITVDDCEKVSHQLRHLFAVENIDYERLEVSSPGLDRPLKTLSDYCRFTGYPAVVKLLKPIVYNPIGSHSRKSFQGVLAHPDGEMLKLIYQTNMGEAVLDFTLSNVDKAHLIPQVDFRSGKI